MMERGKKESENYDDMNVGLKPSLLALFALNGQSETGFGGSGNGTLVPPSFMFGDESKEEEKLGR